VDPLPTGASSGSGYSYRSPHGVTCALACAFMLGCGRWGSHLGLPPLYVGDLLLTVAILHATASRVLAGRRARTGVARRGHPGLVVGALLGWAGLRFALGGDHGLTALRDFAPYGYAVVAFLSASAYACSTAADRRRTLSIIEVALIGHLLWVVPAMLLYAGQEASPMSRGTELFAIRADTDGTVLAITACLYLTRYLRRGGLWRLAVVLVSLGAMFAMTSRAPVLAAVAGLTLTLWYYFAGDSRHANRSRRQMVMAGIAPVAIVIVSLVVPQLPASSKLLASAGVVRADSDIDRIGLNTQRARSEAWERLLAYARQTPRREAVGVGFGPHFMIESGASIALFRSDDPTVRSPHNYPLGTFARLGLLGLGLLGLLGLQILVGVWRVRRYAADDDLVLLAAIVPPMILITATVGVVLEAPFGAIPFFWFLGILLSQPLTAKGNTDASDDQEDLRLRRPPNEVVVVPDPLPSPVP
jgi:hypothetical protein